MEKKLTHYLMISLKGIGMGTADAIPGVSGGTIAMITGIYEELLTTIKNVPVAFKFLITSKFNLKLFWKKLNGNFLLALLSGIGLGFLSLAKLVTYLLHQELVLKDDGSIVYLIKNQTVPTWAFFFGLVLASVWFILKDIKIWKSSYIVLLILGAVSGFLITEVTPAQTPDQLWFISLSGAIAVCAMILPGISGSFILLLLGKYTYMLEALHQLRLSDILAFIVGAVLGLISFSHFLSWLLKKYHAVTIAFLAGVLFGSLNKIWPWKQVLETTVNSKGEIVPLLEKNVLPEVYSQITGLPSMFLYAILLMVAGFSIIFIIDGIAAKKGK